MSPRTVFLARLIGLFALLLSLTELLHKQATVETAAALVRDRPLLFILAILSPEAVAGWIDFLHFEQLFYLYAGITLVLGLYLTYAGFKASPPSR